MASVYIETNKYEHSQSDTVLGSLLDYYVKDAVY